MSCLSTKEMKLLHHRAVITVLTTLMSGAYLAAVFTICYQGIQGNFIGLVVSGAVGIATTVSLHLSCKQYNPPSSYGVWLFPYVPALSVWLNCFLLGQLKAAAYERFGIWTVIVTSKWDGCRSPACQSSALLA